MQASQQIFRLHSEYKPTGDQPQAIEKLVVFCGVWGGGKTGGEKKKTPPPQRARA